MGNYLPIYDSWSWAPCKEGSKQAASYSSVQLQLHKFPRLEGSSTRKAGGKHKSKPGKRQLKAQKVEEERKEEKAWASLRRTEIVQPKKFLRRAARLLGSELGLRIAWMKCDPPRRARRRGVGGV